MIFAALGIFQRKSLSKVQLLPLAAAYVGDILPATRTHAPHPVSPPHHLPTALESQLGYSLRCHQAYTLKKWPVSSLHCYKQPFTPSGVHRKALGIWPKLQRALAEVTECTNPLFQPAPVLHWAALHAAKTGHCPHVKP